MVVIRGRFRPIINVHLDMLNQGVKQFMEEPGVDKENVVVISELTLQSLKERNADLTADIDEKRTFRTRGYYFARLGKQFLCLIFMSIIN